MNADAIAVVVVSYQSAPTIEACLQRLLQAQDVAEIRVIDNGSSDGSLDIVQRLALADNRLRFIANPDNPGFAVACNQGAAASTAPWLAFVNPDLMVEPDSLLRLRDAARQQGTALLGAELHDEAGVHDAAARRRDPDFVAMLRRHAARNLAIARDAAQPVQPVPAVSGALLLLPRSLFTQVGGFDEGYRLHAEDLDLCRRVRAAGATVACANHVEVLHLRGVSSRSNPLFVEWHKHRGLWRYFCKFDAPRHGLWARAAVFALIGTRFLLAALGKIIKP
ncbi:MAG: glycosyltransferase family 2 protein [Pseudomonadota bacterium]|nr:glycosyltransferase family 2 protein [Pseudomonadota bacterium]